MEIKLGQDYFVAGSPELSLLATGNWCSRIRVRGESSNIAVSEFVHKYAALGKSMLILAEKSEEVVEHFDIAIFSEKNNASENQFGFLIDNKGENKQCAVAHIYSLQDKRMVFNGFAVPPGKASQLVRYDTDDRAFCLIADPAVLEEETSKRTAREIFEDVQKNKKDVCAFSIVLTRAEASPLRGLLAETDSISSDGPSPHYAKLVKGSETNQKFTCVKLDYEDAPIHVYNVVLFIRQK